MCTRREILSLERIALGVLVSCLLLSCIINQQVRGQEDVKAPGVDGSSRASPLSSEKKAINSSRPHSADDRGPHKTRGKGSDMSGSLGQLEDDIKALNSLSNLIKKKSIAPDRAMTLPLADILFCGKVILLDLWDIIPIEDFPYQCCLLPLAEKLMPLCRKEMPSVSTPSPLPDKASSSIKSPPPPTRAPTRAPFIAPASKKNETTTTTRPPISSLSLSKRHKTKTVTTSTERPSIKHSKHDSKKLETGLKASTDAPLSQMPGVINTAKPHRPYRRRRPTSTTTTSSPTTSESTQTPTTSAPI